MNDQPMEVTRRSLHAVAELVLAGPQYQQSHTIQLTVSSGGFRTLAAPHLAVAGTDLIYGEHRLGIAGRTCAELAAAVGVPVRTLGDVYSDGSGVGPHETLRLDPELAYWIEDCWAAGDSAMRRLAPAEQPVLWPEHFDVGVLVDGMGYGVSPGDKCLSEPYAYATPPSPRAGSFWNAPFGAARPMRDLGRSDPDAVLAFFTDAHRRAAADPPA